MCYWNNKLDRWLNSLCIVLLANKLTNTNKNINLRGGGNNDDDNDGDDDDVNSNSRISLAPYSRLVAVESQM